jgi:transposase
MEAKRRKHDTAFQARVGLEALKAQKTTQQIAGEYEVHPTQVSEWKRTLSEGLGAAFQKGKGDGAKSLSGSARGCIPRSGS